MTKKILLVEDNHHNATLVRKVVASQGYQYYWAQNAETGLDLAIKEDPDLILLDLGLPDVDGQTLFGWMRMESKLDDKPILAITAWPEETALRMVEAYGFDAYISKPLDIKKFIQTLKSYLD
jgi:two-component system cell cycle response regulator DivK